MNATDRRRREQIKKGCMANWCRNEVRISGRENRVREFLEFAKSENGESLFDFNRFVPRPPQRRRMDRMYSGWTDAWYGDNWGATSNACDARYDEMTERDGECTASVLFETAWSQPWRVVLMASQLFPDLQLELFYFEPHGDFTGRFRCEGGMVTFRESGPCEHTILET